MSGCLLDSIQNNIGSHGFVVKSMVMFTSGPEATWLVAICSNVLSNLVFLCLCTDCPGRPLDKKVLLEANYGVWLIQQVQRARANAAAYQLQVMC